MFDFVSNTAAPQSHIKCNAGGIHFHVGGGETLIAISATLKFIKVRLIVRVRVPGRRLGDVSPWVSLPHASLKLATVC